MKTAFHPEVLECVNKLFDAVPESRDITQALVLSYWLYCDNLNYNLDALKGRYILINELPKLTSPETITRAGRYLRNQKGLYEGKTRSRSTKNTEKNVRYILANYSQTKKDDSLLVLIYWILFDGLNKYVDDLINGKYKFKYASSLTNPDTITRRRRIIQNDNGYYRPSKVVVDSRKTMEDIYKKTAVALNNKKNLFDYFG